MQQKYKVHIDCVHETKRSELLMLGRDGRCYVPKHSTLLGKCKCVCATSVRVCVRVKWSSWQRTHGHSTQRTFYDIDVSIELIPVSLFEVTTSKFLLQHILCHTRQRKNQLAIKHFFFFCSRIKFSSSSFADKYFCTHFFKWIPNSIITNCFLYSDLYRQPISPQKSTAIQFVFAIAYLWAHFHSEFHGPQNE